MRLSELRPQWINLPSASDGISIPVGMMFRCPNCRKARISVAFANPIDPLGLLAGSTWRPGLSFMAGPMWERSGESFETITLAPSIDRNRDGHWHGSIVNGEIITSTPGGCAS